MEVLSHLRNRENNELFNKLVNSGSYFGSEYWKQWLCLHMKCLSGSCKACPGGGKVGDDDEDTPTPKPKAEPKVAEPKPKAEAKPKGV